MDIWPRICRTGKTKSDYHMCFDNLTHETKRQENAIRTADRAALCFRLSNTLGLCLSRFIQQVGLGKKAAFSRGFSSFSHRLARAGLNRSRLPMFAFLFPSVCCLLFFGLQSRPLTLVTLNKIVIMGKCPSGH